MVTFQTHPSGGFGARHWMAHVPTLSNQSPVLSLLSPSFPLALAFDAQTLHRNCTPRYLLYGATSPSTILTIFYILYRPPLQTPVSCFLVSFDFELCKMWMLPLFILYQSCLSFARFPFVLAPLAVWSVLLVRFLAHSDRLSLSSGFPIAVVPSYVPPHSDPLIPVSSFSIRIATHPTDFFHPDFPRALPHFHRYLYHHHDFSSLSILSDSPCPCPWTAPYYSV